MYGLVQNDSVGNVFGTVRSCLLLCIRDADPLHAPIVALCRGVSGEGACFFCLLARGASYLGASCFLNNTGLSETPDTYERIRTKAKKNMSPLYLLLGK